MAQLLRVIKDPSIVDNVPTTPLEQLQIATEKKAAEMAAARNGAQPLASRSVSTVPVSSGGSLQPTQAQMQAIRTIARALQPPISHSAIATQERLTDTPSPIMAFDGDQHTGMTSAPGLAAINGAMVPRPRVDPRGYFLRGDPGQTDWSIANQGGAGLGGPASAPYAGPANGPPMISRSPMIAASRPSAPSGQVMIASGRTVPIGAAGTAQGGRYSYAVQPDGSIAKTINPTPVATNDSSYFAGSREQAQQNTLKALGFHGDGY